MLTDIISQGRKSILLLGPRQVGKSTLINSLRPNMTINLASPSLFRDYTARPERLEAELRGAGPDVKTVFIDEVQRIPELLNLVQVILDESPDRFRFYLSGSSARKLRRGQANLLPGRIHMHYLHPLLISELGDEYDLNRVLAHGTLPGVYSETDPQARAADLRAYTDIYLKEEIQAEALVRNLGGFSRLLELIAISSGRILNLNALCGDAGVRYETARRYIDVLEDTLVMFKIPAWSRSKRAGLLTHPKVFFFDLGVRNALLRRPLDRPLSDETGLLFEHLVAYEIHRRLGSLWPEGQLFYYRTRSGTEVNFVLQFGSEIWGIEVKSSTDVTAKALSGLGSFAECTHGVTRQIVIFNGERRQQIGNVEILPLFDFLGELPV